MTAIEKFTFSLSFDDADNVIRSAVDEDEHSEPGKKKKKKEEAPPPPPPVYTEEQGAQMEADAQQKGHEQGFAEGHKQGFEEAHQQIMASLEKAVGDVESEIAEKLGQIDEQQKRANAKINEDAIHVALGVIRKLAPAWSAQYDLIEIENIVRQCLANLFEAPKVMIKVHPDLETPVREASERIALSRGFSGKVIVVGEPEVATGDCLVSWGDGTAVRDSARVWSEINMIIDTALDLHADDHDLPESDMGDPEVQESRIPAENTSSGQPNEDVETSTAEVTKQAEDAFDQITDELKTPLAEQQEGDGTDARNMQTSQDDTTPEPARTNDAPDQPVTRSPAAPQTASEPAPPLKNGQTETQENPTTRPDTMAAVKQPSKDPGDENG